MTTKTDEPLPPDTVVYRHMSVNDFRADTEAVNGLREFLQSGPGIKMLRVIEARDPMVAMSTPESMDSKTIRGTAAIQGGNESALLGVAQGYACIKNLIVQTLTTHLNTRRPPVSKRAGASPTDPHKTAMPS